MSKKTATVYVHDGVFHADDVLCVAMIQLYYDEYATIIRRRINTDDEIAEIALGIKDDEQVFILDTGNTDIDDKCGLVAFDHHSNIKTCYPNGIMMAACGKLFEWLYDNWMLDPIIGQRQKEKIQKTVFWPIEAQDNGQNITELNVKLFPNLFAWVGSFNSFWNEDSDLQDARFIQAVCYARRILEREIDKVNSSVACEKRIIEIIDSRKYDNMIVLGTFMPWQEPVINYNESVKEDRIKLVIYENISGNYNVQGVPVTLGATATVVSMPEEWRGLKNEELAKVTGIEDSVFCHSNGFLSVFKTKESAIKAAEMILKKILK